MKRTRASGLLHGSGKSGKGAAGTEVNAKKKRKRKDDGAQAMGMKKKGGEREGIQVELGSVAGHSARRGIRTTRMGWGRTEARRRMRSR